MTGFTHRSEQDTRHLRQPSIVGGTMAVLIGALLLAPSASAAPTPDIGPTAGGTTVQLDCADFGFTYVDAGSHNALAISADGRVFTWGDTNFSALGGSGGTSYPDPIAQGEIPAGTKFVDGAVSLWGGYALAANGTVYAWGLNTSGELGNGSFPVVSDSIQPVAVSQGAIPAGVTPVDVVAGSGNAGILGDNGWAYTWGNGNSGINGDGTQAWRSTPVAVAQGAIPAGVTITQLVIGNSTSYALGSDGWVYSWGYRGFGALGDGALAPANQLTPARIAQGAVPAGVTFTQISAGNNTAYALGTDGKIYAWGDGFLGELGNGTIGAGARELSPVAVSQGELPAGVTYTWVDADAGASTVAAKGSDGKLYSWGQGTYGSLGNGTTTNIATPALVHQGAVPASVTLSAPVVQQFVTYALGNDGAVYSWGGVDQPQYLGSMAATGTTEPAFGATIGVTEVLFDDVPGTDLNTSTCPITVVTPPHAAGPVNVGVKTGVVAGTTATGSTSQVTYPDGFTYFDAVHITTPSLPGGTVGVGYSSPVAATGTGPITFEVSSGSLPPGLSIDPDTGLISGSPTQAGVFTFTVKALNSDSSDLHDYTVEISAVNPTDGSTEPTSPTDGSTEPTDPTGTSTEATETETSTAATGTEEPTATSTEPSTTSQSSATSTSTGSTVVVLPTGGSTSSPSTTVSTTATTSDSISVAPTTGNNGGLAHTGTGSAIPLLTSGLVLLVMGGGALVFARTRRAH
ncbi:hypothetical protein D1871_18355 [Nakamurella silvestris]|nr:hypothetical protein D1871_18355 [Nakamurella silvestris]